VTEIIGLADQDALDLLRSHAVQQDVVDTRPLQVNAFRNRISCRANGMNSCR
jgi:hypothetical protein